MLLTVVIIYGCGFALVAERAIRSRIGAGPALLVAAIWPVSAGVLLAERWRG